MNHCETCRLGRYHPAQVPYLCWLDGQIVLVSNAPAEVCDICGETIFDDGFEQFMHVLIEHGTVTGKQNTANHQRLPSAIGLDWQRTRRST